MRAVFPEPHDAGPMVGLTRSMQKKPFSDLGLSPESLKAVDGWLEHYRRLWDEPLDRLEDYLHDIQTKGKKEKKNGNGRK